MTTKPRRLVIYIFFAILVLFTNIRQATASSVGVEVLPFVLFAPAAIGSTFIASGTGVAAFVRDNEGLRTHNFAKVSVGFGCVGIASLAVLSGIYSDKFNVNRWAATSAGFALNTLSIISGSYSIFEIRESKRNKLHHTAFVPMLRYSSRRTLVGFTIASSW